MRSEFVLVHSEWQDNIEVDANRCALRIIDPTFVFNYRQHGRTRAASEPMQCVEFYLNDGPWRGVASYRALKAAGVKFCTVGFSGRYK